MPKKKITNTNKEIYGKYILVNAYALVSEIERPRVTMPICISEEPCFFVK